MGKEELRRTDETDFGGHHRRSVVLAGGDGDDHADRPRQYRCCEPGRRGGGRGADRIGAATPRAIAGAPQLARGDHRPPPGGRVCARAPPAGEVAMSARDASASAPPSWAATQQWLDDLDQDAPPHSRGDDGWPAEPDYDGEPTDLDV